MQAYCRMCGARCINFAHSHIIPKAFTPHDMNGSRKVVVAGGNGLMKKRQNGIWDERILCHHCEQVLGKYDQYSVDIFRDKKHAEHIQLPDGGEVVYFERVERRLLRGFLASILWRTSVSQLDDCKNINIGETYERRIAKDLLTDGDFNYIDSLTFVANNSISKHLVLLPAKMRLLSSNKYSVNGYKIKLPELEFLVSLDQRGDPLTINTYIIDRSGASHTCAMSLERRFDKNPYIIPIIRSEENSVEETLSILASHKAQKEQWVKMLRERGK